MCFLEFSEVVCDLSCAFYPSYKQQQAAKEGGAGGSLGKAPSGKQEGKAVEVTDQDAHMSTISQHEGEWSRNHLEWREGGAHIAWQYIPVWFFHMQWPCH